MPRAKHKIELAMDPRAKTSNAANSSTTPPDTAATTFEPQDPDEPCYFGKLSPELRNTIYNLALTSPTPITVRDADSWEPRINRDPFQRSLTLAPALPQSALNLLCVCKAMYTEGISIMYGQNSFVFASSKVFDEFLMCVEFENHRFFGDFDIRCSNSLQLHDYFSWMRTSSGLRKLHIRLAERLEPEGGEWLLFRREKLKGFLKRFVDEGVSVAVRRKRLDAITISEKRVYLDGSRTWSDREWVSSAEGGKVVMEVEAELFREGRLDSTEVVPLGDFWAY